MIKLWISGKLAVGFSTFIDDWQSQLTFFGFCDIIMPIIIINIIISTPTVAQCVPQQFTEELLF